MNNEKMFYCTISDRYNGELIIDYYVNVIDWYYACKKALRCFNNKFGYAEIYVEAIENDGPILKGITIIHDI